MNKNSVAEALRALAGSQSRSETARLREVFDEVETALSAGVSRTAILETLHSQGFAMTAKSFESALYRLRKQRESGKPLKAKEERVDNTAANPTERAAAPQSFTPKEMDEDQSEVFINLTQKERREKRADQFIKPDSTNPLLKNLKGRKP